MKIKLMTTLLFLLIIVPNVNAIGISPSLKQIDFVGGDERTFTFKIINDESKNMQVFLKLDGDLQYYSELQDKVLTISHNEPYKSFTIKVKFPEELPQNWINTLKVIGVEKFERETYNPPSIIPELQVVSRLEVLGPFEGKHIEAQLETKDAKDNQASEFDLKIKNYGTEKIDNAKISYLVYSESGELLDTIDGGETTVDSGESKEFKTTWKSETIGSFYTKAKIEYEQKEALTEDEFYIGEPYIAINKATTKLSDNILIFDMNLESLWNTELEVKARIIVTNPSGLIIGESQTQVFQMPGFETKKIQSFVDIGQNFDGKGEAKILLEYADRTTKYILKIDNSKLPYGIIILVIMIIALSITAIRLMKKLKKANN